MLCPYCHELMTDGRVAGGRGWVYWIPRTASFLTGPYSSKSVILGAGEISQAFYCADCKKIIVETDSVYD